VSDAVRRGLAHATRPYVAVVDQNVKVVTGWLDRLIGHLGANRSLGAVTASLRQRTMLSDSELIAPPDPPDATRWQPALGRPGQVMPAVTASGAVMVAETELLRRVLDDAAADPFGRDPGALGVTLAGQDRRLGRAPDVVAYRFDETKGENDPAIIERIIDCQSAALRSGTAETVPVTTPLQDFSTVVSRQLTSATDDFFAVVCDGVVTTPDWLPLSIAHLEADPTLAAIGPATNEGATTQQHLGNVDYADLQQLPDFARRWTRLHRGEYSFASRLLPFCLVLRRRCVESVGGLDPAYASASGAIEDLSIRLTMAGYRMAVANDVFVHCPGELKQILALEDVTRLQQFYETFNPQAPRWESDVTKPHRLLLIPRWETPAWRRTITAYLRAFTSADPVALIVRVESPTAEGIDSAFRDVSALIAELQLSPEHSADIVFEGTHLPDVQRGGLYTAATGYLRCTPDAQPALVREAVACGLPVLTAPEPEQLRHWVLG
ncbi:MAG: hypothetical protein QOI66_2665, partial [Myxococcales bacterium]|nr:hypothetical protein [Myxococcales bacterium]